MFDKKDKDKQVEFFADYSCTSKKSRRPKLSLGKIALSLSYENIIILAIGMIMVLIVCYSLGVERGKDLAQANIKGLDASTQVTESETITKDEEKASQKEESEPLIKKRKVKIAVTEPFYTIQVATFLKSSSVEKEVQRLKNKGYESFIVSKGKYTEICIGKYKHKNEAATDLKELKRLYGDCFVRKQ
ncbi:MAG: SPOR domain-containing protein [Candidatus Omnitrophica bacterium]|nr:SPOR domain-containing protein [Candidatus Omnitrophota bacterium]